MINGSISGTEKGGSLWSKVHYYFPLFAYDIHQLSFVHVSTIASRRSTPVEIRTRLRITHYGYSWKMMSSFHITNPDLTLLHLMGNKIYIMSSASSINHSSSRISYISNLAEIINHFNSIKLPRLNNGS